MAPAGYDFSMAGLRGQVSVYLAEYFMADAPISEDTLLVDDLGADSLDLLQVVHMLDDMFDIEIDVDCLPRMLTVGGVFDVVLQLRLQAHSVTES